ncbi:MAG: hypothetical protein K0Q73_1672 [Paenibacillus sp.]|jgi:hypothetical protein|nr:hypothetical protein [Paenibacillus sp.]
MNDILGLKQKLECSCYYYTNSYCSHMDEEFVRYCKESALVCHEMITLTS